MIKFKKMNLSFGDRMALNVKLKNGEIKNAPINEELAEAIKNKIILVTRAKNKNYYIADEIIESGICNLSWTINKGWTIIDVQCEIFGDMLYITKINEDTLERTDWYFKIEY